MTLHGFLIAVVLLTASLATAMAQSPATVLDGVYTTAQAERGHLAYESRCVGCHEGQDADGPELTGKVFLDRWREDKLESLFTFIRTSMPGNNPGTLDERTVADIVAYILEANNLPAGNTDLRPDMVGRIQLVGTEGPRPLANLTIVRTVGCLTAEAGNAWMLVKAGTMAAVRDRVVEGTTPEELKRSATQPLGTLRFPLLSVSETARKSAGHKVQVKGVLTRQKDVDRINVMSLESLSATC